MDDESSQSDEIIKLEMMAAFYKSFPNNLNKVLDICSPGNISDGQVLCSSQIRTGKSMTHGSVFVSVPYVIASGPFSSGYSTRALKIVDVPSIRHRGLSEKSFQRAGVYTCQRSCRRLGFCAPAIK